MKTNLITLAISLATLVVTLFSAQGLLANPSAYTRYYITAVIGISGTLASICALRLLMMTIHRPTLSSRMVVTYPDQRRADYRLTFDQPPHPLFVESDAAHLPSDAYTCAVKDISQTGLSLLCTGVYATGQTVHGEVIFASGRTAQINGCVVREESGQTCLTLHCSIEPSVFMAEQRERIESEKSLGPRPAVSKGALEKPSTSLPSYRPKGICRIK
jgi:hypothetical protein